MRDAYRDELFKQYVENLQSYIKVQRTQSVDVWTIKYVLLDAPLLVDEGKGCSLILEIKPLNVLES